jgi:hypothetical protein
MAVSANSRQPIEAAHTIDRQVTSLNSTVVCQREVGLSLLEFVSATEVDIPGQWVGNWWTKAEISPQAQQFDETICCHQIATVELLPNWQRPEKTDTGPLYVAVLSAEVSS